MIGRKEEVTFTLPYLYVDYVEVSYNGDEIGYAF